MTKSAEPRPKARFSRLVIWLALLAVLLIWGGLQSPTRLEPVPWTGTLDI